MSELEIDSKTEAPLYPPKIINTEVILNPFNDIIPRERQILSNTSPEQEHPKLLKSQSSLNKANRSLLSFADDESVPINPEKPPSLSSKSNTALSHSSQSRSQPTSQPIDTSSSISSSSSSLQFLQQMKAVQMRDTQDKIKQMEEELGFRVVEKKQAEHKEVEKNISALERYRAKFEENKKRKAAIELKDEMDTFLLLNSFRQKIQKAEISNESNDEMLPLKKHLDICKLHGLLDCLSCRDTFNINLNASESENNNEKDWMMHKLVFDRRELEGQVREDLKDLVVIDPREQQAQISDKNNLKKDKMK